MKKHLCRMTRRRIALPLALIAVTGVLYAGALQASETREQRAERLYYTGLYEEIGLGRPEKAIEYYGRIISVLSSSNGLRGEALVRKGICLEKLGKNEEALDIYSRAINGYSNNAAILKKALPAWTRLHEEKKSAASAKARQPVDRKKEFASLVSEGRNHLRRGELKKARESFAGALAREPGNHELQLQIAAICERLNEYRLATIYYSVAADSEEYRADFAVHRKLAECHRKNRQFSLAKSVWREFLSGENLSARDARAARLEQEMILEEEEYSPKLSIPWGLRLFLNKGRDLAIGGKYKEAVRTYEQAKKKFPRHYLPPLRLGYIYDNYVATSEIPASTRDYARREIGAKNFSLSKAPQILAVINYLEALASAPPATAQRLRCRLAELYEDIGDLANAEYQINRYFSSEPRPVENDQKIRERIRKKRLWYRVEKLREE